MIADKKVKYWNTLLVNIENIKEEWERHSRKLKSFLKANDADKKKGYVDFIYPGNNFQKEDIDNHYVEILKKPNAKDLQGLRAFLNGKNSIIEEYIANNSDRFTELEKRNLLLALIKIFKDPNKLVYILLMEIWNSKSIDETFLFGSEVTDEKIRELRGWIGNLIMSIKRKCKGKYEFKGMYEYKNNNIFWLEKQESDKVLRSFSKNIRFKPSKDLLFNLNNKENLLELKCRNKKLLETVKRIIARKLSIDLFYHHQDSEVRTNLSKFEKGLSTIRSPKNDSDTYDKNIGICGIAFNRIKLSNSAPIIIPKRSGRDIRKTLDELHNDEIIDLKDIRAIDYLKILYNDSDRKIIFRIDEEGTLTLVLDSKHLTRDKIHEISELFEEQFGVPVGKTISETDENQINENVYNLIFSSEIIDKVTELITVKLDYLSEKRLINYEGNKVYLCKICKKTFSEIKKCPNCGEDLKFILPKVKIKRNAENILNLIKEKLKSNDFEVNDRLVQRTYWNEKKKFIQLYYEKQTIYAYFNDGENINNMIKYFHHSNVPIILINNSKKRLKDLDEEIFPQTALSKLLLMSDDKIKEYFNSTLSKLKEKIEIILMRSADKSYDRLSSYLNGTNEQYDESMLEDDVYNLIRYIFKTGEKWGKNRSGKTVPEGIIGYGFLKKTGTKWNTFLRTIIWDCKFTKGKVFDFSRYIKIQARDYVIRTSQSKAIKKHSKQLSAYINFTNNVNQAQYNDFAKKVKNIRDWKGNVVLFELKALVKLFRLMKRKYTELDSRRNQLYFKLNNMIGSTEKDKNYALITELKIDSLISELLEGKEDIPQLDYEKTFLSLETDEIRIRG